VAPRTKNPEILERLLSQDEVAARYQIQPDTVRFWRWSGTGPAWLKVGAKVMYRESDLLAWEQAQRHEAASA
jgi:hypothetical protein